MNIAAKYCLYFRTGAETLFLHINSIIVTVSDTVLWNIFSMGLKKPCATTTFKKNNPIATTNPVEIILIQDFK